MCMPAITMYLFNYNIKAISKQAATVAITKSINAAYRLFFPDDGCGGPRYKYVDKL